LFGVSKIETLEALESSSAVLHAGIQYGNAVLDHGRFRTKANCMKKLESLQLVEKKGKRANSIAWVIYRPENRLDRLKLQSEMKTIC
jgi:hypothetical protein